MLWNALCGEATLLTSNVETEQMKSSIVNAKWGKNARFIYPRLMEHKLPSICGDSEFINLFPTKLTTSNKNSSMDLLMRNIPTSILSSDGSTFPKVWNEIIVPRIELVYQKFNKSYQELIKEQFLPRYIGDNGDEIIAMAESNPELAYKKIQEQDRARYGLPAKWLSFQMGNAGGSVIQTYVDELDSYLKIIKDSFEFSIKQDLAIKYASQATPKQKSDYASFLEKRKKRFDILVNNFKNSFIKIILSFGTNNVDVEQEYAALMVSYYYLARSVGILGDVKITFENEKVGGEIETIVKVNFARSTLGEMLYSAHLKETKKEQIEQMVKGQLKSFGTSDQNVAEALANNYVNDLVDDAYAGRIKMRLEHQRDIRDYFTAMKKEVEGNRQADNPYQSDRNMSLPLIDAQSMTVSINRGTLQYSLNEEGLSTQFLGLLGAVKSLDELMEEVYANVNVLMAASVDSKYRNVEKERLKKFKSNSMGK